MREGKEDNKKGSEQEVVSKNPDWRHCTGAKVSVLFLAAREQLNHTPVLHGCCSKESEHGLEFSEDVIHKGTVNQTQTSLQNLTVQAKLIASRRKVPDQRSGIHSILHTGDLRRNLSHTDLYQGQEAHSSGFHIPSSTQSPSRYASHKEGKRKFKFHALERNKNHHLEIQRRRQIDIQSRCVSLIETWQKSFSGSGRKNKSWLSSLAACCAGPAPPPLTPPPAVAGRRKIKKIKDFLLMARRKDAKSVKIKKNRDNVKFKVWCSRYLYTLVIMDKEKAEKLKQSLPPGLAVKELK
ncbi:PREDICTED: uncharacterized protein LOC101374709 [Odobenus rosmarus divergens]|uniref:Large ribosomal subunit protein eL38 n=1 Tax=Odobenus rosmarus divergens TaxID=9708 RepID=A0A9B0LQF8_ODORO